MFGRVPSVGSSSSSSIAISSHWRSPCDSAEEATCARAASPTRSSAHITRSRGSWRHLDVLVAAEAREDGGRLELAADAPANNLVLAHARQVIHGVEAYGAGVHAHLPRDHIGQRRLAGGADPIAAFAAALVQTERIVLGTAILQTWPRHPIVITQQTLALEVLPRAASASASAPCMKATWRARTAWTSRRR